jgi:hypothetical protein
MDTVFPVFIATRGRAGKSPTIPLLLADGLSPVLFVEPQEAAAYTDAYPQAQQIVLPLRDQGLAFARQAELAIARTLREEWVWLLDDDIGHFYTVLQGKCTKIAPSACLLGAQALFAALPNVAQASLEYQQYAWSAKRPLVYDSYCDVAVCLHMGRTRTVNFRTELPLKGDRDFTLQLLSQGYHVVRVTRYAFEAPQNGSNAGGLHDTYAITGRELAACRMMAERWPGICEPIVKPSGRHDLKIHWKKLVG